MESAVSIPACGSRNVVRARWMRDGSLKVRCDETSRAEVPQVTPAATNLVGACAGSGSGGGSDRVRFSYSHIDQQHGAQLMPDINQSTAECLNRSVRARIHGSVHLPDGARPALTVAAKRPGGIWLQLGSSSRN